MGIKRRLEITRRAKRDLSAIEQHQRSAVVEAITAFAAGEPNSDIRKLHGYHPERWRLRAGRYRAILALEPDSIVVERIVLRRDAYR